MDQPVKNEFEVNGFAKYYREVADTFIDTKGAAASLVENIRKGETIFEIGLGTGYFAEQLNKAGYDVCGIQPVDEMLKELLKLDNCVSDEKQRSLIHPNIILLAQEKLEDFVFPATYDVIVSHSSVFQFTLPEAPIGSDGEFSLLLVFQSEIRDKLQTLTQVEKVLDALSKGGRFFVNIQSNPLPRVEVGPADDRLVFEMTRCVYDLDSEKVEKTFRTAYRSKIDTIPVVHYCARYSDFKRCIEMIGGQVRLTHDRRWAVLDKSVWV